MSVSRPLVALPVLAALLALAGCDVPSVPLLDGPVGNAPTLTGSLQGVDTTGNVRVGLIGAPKAGGAKIELVSTAVSAGRYALTLPASPRLNFMSTDNESIAMTLTAYKDINKNNTFDAGDEVLEAAAQTGTFRWFAEDGPSGSYKRGWNVYSASTGMYSQNFQTAFDMRAGTTTYRVHS